MPIPFFALKWWYPKKFWERRKKYKRKSGGDKTISYMQQAYINPSMITMIRSFGWTGQKTGE